MIRYTIHAKIESKPKMKYGHLFKDKRTYKTYAYAKKIKKDCEWTHPELLLKIVEVEVKGCPTCGK